MLLTGLFKVTRNGCCKEHLGRFGFRSSFSVGASRRASGISGKDSGLRASRLKCFFFLRIQQSSLEA